MCNDCFLLSKDQNGDSHHVGDLKISGKEFLSLPARSKKYREHQSSSERKSQGSSTSPLDTSEVRVQVSQSVGRLFFSFSTDLGVSYSVVFSYLFSSLVWKWQCGLLVAKQSLHLALLVTVWATVGKSFCLFEPQHHCPFNRTMVPTSIIKWSTRARYLVVVSVAFS